MRCHHAGRMLLAPPPYSQAPVAQNTVPTTVGLCVIGQWNRPDLTLLAHHCFDQLQLRQNVRPQLCPPTLQHLFWNEYKNRQAYFPRLGRTTKRKWQRVFQMRQTEKYSQRLAWPAFPATWETTPSTCRPALTTSEQSPSLQPNQARGKLGTEWE